MFTGIISRNGWSSQPKTLISFRDSAPAGRRAADRLQEQSQLAQQWEPSASWRFCFAPSSTQICLEAKKETS